MFEYGKERILHFFSFPILVREPEWRCKEWQLATNHELRSAFPVACAVHTVQEAGDAQRENRRAGGEPGRILCNCARAPFARLSMVHRYRAPVWINQARILFIRLRHADRRGPRRPTEKRDAGHEETGHADHFPFVRRRSPNDWHSYTTMLTKGTQRRVSFVSSTCGQRPMGQHTADCRRLPRPSNPAKPCTTGKRYCST